MGWFGRDDCRGVGVVVGEEATLLRDRRLWVSLGRVRDGGVGVERMVGWLVG